MVKAEAPIPTTKSSSSTYYETVPPGLTREEFEDLKPINVIYGLPAPTSTERLDVMDEERRVTGFSIIGGDHRLKNYKSVTSVHEVKRDVKVRLNLQKLASVAEAGQVITDGRGGLSTSGYRKDLDAQFFTTSQGLKSMAKSDMPHSVCISLQCPSLAKSITTLISRISLAEVKNGLVDTYEESQVYATIFMQYAFFYLVLFRCVNYFHFV